MSEDATRPAQMVKAASEPDLALLPHGAAQGAPSSPPPTPPPLAPPPPPLPPPLALPPPSPRPSPRLSPRLSPRGSPRGSPRLSPRTSQRTAPSPPPLPLPQPAMADAPAVSFSAYVASELAAGHSAHGVSFVPALPLDGQRAASAHSSPARPSSPSASYARDDHALPPDAPVPLPPPHEPKFQSTNMSRHGKLACIQLDNKGTVEDRELSRAEILQEARDTLCQSQPSPKAIGRWLSSSTAAQSPSPELREFTNFLEPGTVASRKATQKALRDYLRNSLQARDIRQVDPAFVAKPALWVRHSALVVSLEGLRAIILHNKMFLFDPTKERTRQLVFIAKQSVLARPDEEHPQPFEFKALEGILIFLSMGMEREFASLKPNIEMYLHQLPNELTTMMLEELRRKKQQLNHFHVRASNVKTILENVLDEDEDMANMYLTEKHTSRDFGGRSSVDHSEIETLLEAYLQVIDDHVNQSTLLNEQIDDTEDLMMIHLDTLRNRLLSLELALSVVSMTFGAGGLIAGMFGMNIVIPLFEATAGKFWFWVIVSAIFVIVVTVSWRILLVLRRRGLYSFY